MKMILNNLIFTILMFLIFVQSGSTTPLSNYCNAKSSDRSDYKSYESCMFACNAGNGNVSSSCEDGRCSSERIEQVYQNCLRGHLIPDDYKQPTPENSYDFRHPEPVQEFNDKGKIIREYTPTPSRCMDQYVKCSKLEPNNPDKCNEDAKKCLEQFIGNPSIDLEHICFYIREKYIMSCNGK